MYKRAYRMCVLPSCNSYEIAMRFLKNEQVIAADWLLEYILIHFDVDSIPVTIDSIHEVCEGKKSEIFQRYADSCFDPNCCFSIYHGDHVESLDLVSANGDEARTWITGLKYLMAGISDEDSLAKRQRKRDQYPLLCHYGACHS